MIRMSLLPGINLLGALGALRAAFARSAPEVQFQGEEGQRQSSSETFDAAIETTWNR